MAVAAARAKVAAVARAVAVVVEQERERAREVAILQPDGRRPQEILRAAAGLTTRLAEVQDSESEQRDRLFTLDGGPVWIGRVYMAGTIRGTRRTRC